MSLTVVVEGDTDVPVARKLADDAGLAISTVIDTSGKSQLDKHLPGFLRAAKGSPWLVLRDLDRDAPCAPEFLRRRKLKANSWMALRIAVCEVESWLLADLHGMATFLGLPETALPSDPDAEQDPTMTLVNLARRSPLATVRRRLVPKPGAFASVGPLYEASIIEFAHERWSLERAVRNSESLRSAREALRTLGSRWRAYTNQ